MILHRLAMQTGQSTEREWVERLMINTPFLGATHVIIGLISAAAIMTPRNKHGRKHMLNGKKTARHKDLYGKRFGKLIAVSYSKGKWLCKCDCGGETTTLTTNLTSGNTKSCGCKGRRLSSLRMAKMNLKHGDYGSKEYNTWIGIIKRTKRPSTHNFDRYGAAGIDMCDSWAKYENFLRDMGRAPSKDSSIDRIDNRRGYYPENCRWATPKQQGQNRRTNRYIEVDGCIVTISEAARRLNINKSTMFRKVNRGEFKEVPYRPGGGDYTETKPVDQS